MLVIRLSRVGKKNHPQYKLVVAEKSSPVKGRFVEQLGSYDPHQKTFSVKVERVQHWISKGASCSDTAWNLLVKKGAVKGVKRKVKLPEKQQKESGEAVTAQEEKKAEVDAAKEEAVEKNQGGQDKKEVLEAETKKQEVDSAKEEAKKVETTKEDEKKEEGKKPE